MNKKVKSDVFTFDENVAIITAKSDSNLVKTSKSEKSDKTPEKKIRKNKSNNNFDIDQDIKDDPFFFF